MPSLIERLPKQLIHVKRLPERPPYARERIRDAFARRQCTSCGECCKGWGIQKSFVALENNEGRLIRRRMEELFRQGKMRRSSINSAIATSPTGQDIGLCTDFNEECRLISANLCLVHEIKPHSCKVFPLAGMTEHVGREGRLEYLMLRQRCAAIREIYGAGIRYIELQDVLNRDDSIIVPMLDSVLQYFMELRIDSKWRSFAIARVMGKEILPIKESLGPLPIGFFRDNCL